MALDYRTMQIQDIIDYCVEHNEVKWLKATAAKKTVQKVYPKKTVIDENGKKRTIADKTQPYTTKEMPISFIELKAEFAEKFGFKPPKQDKKPTMHEIIAKL